MLYNTWVYTSKIRQGHILKKNNLFLNQAGKSSANLNVEMAKNQQFAGKSQCYSSHKWNLENNWSNATSFYRNTQNEMEVKRASTLCFRFGDQYYPSHQCSAKTVMAVEEMEEVNEEDEVK